jgi:3-dehydroquinate synthase
MKKTVYKFSDAAVACYFAAGFSQLKRIADQKNSIILTDENVYGHHEKKIRGWRTIILSAGEQYKIQSTVDSIIDQLIAFKADRTTTLIGVGGGVITDLTGYTASVYMRGISFGFVPTTLLAMVDASIGGKNGVDVGACKNLVGTIRQPGFILHDMDFLNSLPQKEWENGFAEIIKHACIKDANMFRDLEKSSFKKYQQNKKTICDLVRRNAVLKTKVVQRDEFERGERRLLNFGHTLGHAIENQYSLLHGQAVAIGMTYASLISAKLLGFKEAGRVANLLLKYDLPTYAAFDKHKVFKMLEMDKKRERNEIHYVLLQKIGKAVIQTIALKKLEQIIDNL